ncbi:MAG TPA: hypothetical protein V6C78_22020 [Crinalium sp.]
MAVSSPLDEVAQKLAQDQNSTRIKKLLVYACKSTWENDAAKLNGLYWRDLIGELIQRYPTLDQLKSHLNKIVQTISKPAEYTLVANVITNSVNSLYVDYQDSTRIITNQTVDSELAHQFESDPDSLRIKKLLFAACYNVWENNPANLAVVSFETLIHQLRDLMPSFDQVRAILENIVDSLNRQAEYRLISNRILAAFETLYPEPVEHTQLVAAVPSPLDQTQFVQPSPPISKQIPDQKSISSSQPSDAISEVDKPSPDEIDWFDVRMEIMKYTSPLRAKILIFSVLYYPIELNHQTWSMLRSHHLNDLVESVFQSHQTLADLEIRLKDTAKRLTESDQYAQTAGAILRTARLVYGRSPFPAPEPTPAPAPSRPSPAQTSAPKATFLSQYPPAIAATMNSEDTCSFFGAPTMTWQPDSAPSEPMTHDSVPNGGECDRPSPPYEHPAATYPTPPQPPRPENDSDDEMTQVF